MLSKRQNGNKTLSKKKINFSYELRHTVNVFTWFLETGHRT